MNTTLLVKVSRELLCIFELQLWSLTPSHMFKIPLWDLVTLPRQIVSLKNVARFLVQ